MSGLGRSSLTFYRNNTVPDTAHRTQDGVPDTAHRTQDGVHDTAHRTQDGVHDNIQEVKTNNNSVVLQRKQFLEDKKEFIALSEGDGGEKGVHSDGDGGRKVVRRDDNEGRKVVPSDGDGDEQKVVRRKRVMRQFGNNSSETREHTAVQHKTFSGKSTAIKSTKLYTSFFAIHKWSLISYSLCSNVKNACRVERFIHVV